MSDNRIIKIETLLGTQIPSFLSEESPLFLEFLKQYYISQEYTTGTLDLVSKLPRLKNLEEYTNDVFYTLNEENKCYLTEPLTTYSDTIEVNSTFGFPEKYGLLQIDDEIITYTNKNENTFFNCVRAFSGVTDINDTETSGGLIFSSTNSSEHKTKSTVKNLNLVFYTRLFEKFKSQYLPDFEKREFNSNINLELILGRARDFYLSKGTDVSYKILFEILYNDAITITKPKDYIIRPSLNTNIPTKNILVEPVSGDFEISDLIGLTLYQDLDNGIRASASIYNVQFRPLDNLKLYEISLDSDSFIYDFVSTKKTSVIETVSDGIIVDSTIGFAPSGSLYVKIFETPLNYSYYTLNYSNKTLTKFLNITNIPSDIFNLIKSNDELLENNLVKIELTNGTIVSFRLLNVIQSFDFSKTRGNTKNDIISISSFGENLSGLSEYTSWLYNHPTTHKVKSYQDQSGTIDITFYDSIRFKQGESILLVGSIGITTTSTVIDILDDKKIKVTKNNSFTLPKIESIKKIIEKSNLNTAEPAFIQNTYIDEDTNSLIVASSGLPHYNNITRLNIFTFNLVGIGSIFESKRLTNNTTFSHNLLSGSRIYLDSKYVGISTGYYSVKKISDSSIKLYKSLGDLTLSYSPSLNVMPIVLNNNANTSLIGTATIVGYENLNKGYSNQLLLKTFPVRKTFNENKLSSNTQINNIEEAYSAFNS